VDITFYGVRGSCPCAGESYRHYGGNTSCMLVEVAGDRPLVIDCGTGLRPLGEAMNATLAAEGRPMTANALLSHLHYDHVLGLPFFSPLTHPGAEFDIYGPAQAEGPLAEVLPRVVAPPFFPVHMKEFGGTVRMIDIGNEDFAIGSVKVRSRSIPHVGHTLGFRIESAGVTLAYVSDHQAPVDGSGVPEAVLELCDGVDLLVHDAQYTEAEFADKATWGHSTVGYAVRVAAESGARRLMMYHHDPAHDDRAIDKMLGSARCQRGADRLEDISAASDGSVVRLGA